MPVIHRHTQDDKNIVLWHITETEDQLSKYVTEEDISSLQGFSALSRRLERLAARAALRTLEPEGLVVYDQAGKPYLVDDSGNVVYHIGFSHTKDLAAVITSPVECSIDIEYKHRDIKPLHRRFITSREDLILKNTPYHDLLIWCAKEALYKVYGKRGIDFLEDIEILQFNNIMLKMSGRIMEKSYTVNFIHAGEYVLAYI